MMTVLARIAVLLGFAVPCASAGPPFNRYGSMSPSEKSLMRTRRIELGKLNSTAQKSVRCRRCAGRGYIVRKVRVQLPGNTSMLKDRRKRCPLCFGSKVHPWDDMNHKMTKYFRAKRGFERDYPFKSPVKSGLQVDIFRRITTDATWRSLNAYSIKKLLSTNREAGEVFIFVVRIESSMRSTDGKSSVMTGLALSPRRRLWGLPVTLYLRESRRGLAEVSKYLVVAWDEGAAMYDGTKRDAQLRDLKRHRRNHRNQEKVDRRNPLTIIYFKHMKG